VAGVLLRLAARVVDLVTLLWCLGFVVIEIDQRLLGGDPLGTRQLAIDISSPRTLLFVVLTIAAYEIVPTVMFRATLGKAVFGLQVVGVEGDRLATVRAVARTFVLYGAPVAFGAYGGAFVLALTISFIVPASGRGLHDRLASSMVIVRA